MSDAVPSGAIRAIILIPVRNSAVAPLQRVIATHAAAALHVRNGVQLLNLRFLTFRHRQQQLRCGGTRPRCLAWGCGR